MRSLAGAVTPIIAAAVSAIWGLGAGGWMGLNLEPLTVVVPVLLMARALSHSLQMTRRYYEILYERQERVAVRGALASMFAPAFLGIMCDVAGLYMICLAPIPIVQKLGILCGTWSLLLIPSAYCSRRVCSRCCRRPRTSASSSPTRCPRSART